MNSYAIGEYAAHILGIIWDVGGIVISVLTGAIGYLIGRERGQHRERREIREQVRRRELRRQIEEEEREEIRRERRTRPLHIDTRRDDPVLRDLQGLPPNLDRAHPPHGPNGHPGRHQR